MTFLARVRARQVLLGFSALGMLALTCTAPGPAQAKDNPRYASIIMDADTGVVISQSNASARLHPASLTKVMTLLLLFEAMERGEIKSSGRIRISKHAASMAPSKLDLPVGSTIKVQDAIYAIVTKSANDVAVAIGERVGGTESNFARMMTRRARELGMSETTFVNASGLHDPRQFSSARDMALLARTVINDYPGYYRNFSKANFVYGGKNYHNHNRLMETYKGMDGMKTGYVGPSGFNLVASAVRNDRRLIGVVFGGKTAASRNAHMAELLDSGFTKLPDVRIAKANTAPPSGITTAALDPSLDRSINRAVSAYAPDKVMALRQPAPIPPRKPAILVALNSLKKPVTANGAARPPEVKLASMGPILDTERFGELVGEGDIDPAESRRIETGLVAVSAIKGEEIKTNASFRQPQQPRMLTSPTQNLAQGSTDAWAIQIGAYSSRAATDQAIHQSVKKLPAALAVGRPAIAPLKVKDGWVFRARLGGYSREEAFRACKYIKDCMPVAPQNN